MSTNPNDPVHHPAQSNASHDKESGAIAFTHGGSLTKREHFAAMAMQGLWAQDNWDHEGGAAEAIAELAVRSADQLIASLNAPAKA